MSLERKTQLLQRWLAIFFVVSIVTTATAAIPTDPAETAREVGNMTVTQLLAYIALVSTCGTVAIAGYILRVLVPVLNRNSAAMEHCPAAREMNAKKKESES